jgi:hypothetical protein
VEIGLVAQLAGHASALVTIGHYTQAVRGAEMAVKALDDERWSRLSEQIFRIDKWSVCRG